MQFADNCDGKIINRNGMLDFKCKEGSKKIKWGESLSNELGLSKYPAFNFTSRS